MTARICDVTLVCHRTLSALLKSPSFFPPNTNYSKILILSMHKKKEYVFHVFSAGAKGYLLKEDTGTELFSAIETVRKGETYVSPLLSRELAGDLI